MLRDWSCFQSPNLILGSLCDDSSESLDSTPSLDHQWSVEGIPPHISWWWFPGARIPAMDFLPTFPLFWDPICWICCIVLSKKIEKCYDIYIFTLWISIVPIVLSILGLRFMEIMKPGSMPGNPAVARQGEQRDFLFSETGPWKTTPRLFDFCTSWGPPKDS